MSKRLRRNHAPAFKAKVALEAVRGEKTLHAKIGELTLTNDFLSGALSKPVLSLPKGPDF